MLAFIIPSTARTAPSRSPFLSGARSFSICSPRCNGAHGSAVANQGANDDVSPLPYDVLFCGTDTFASTALRALYEAKDVWKSIHVLAPPDTRQSWGARRMSIAPVKTLASELDLPVSTVPREGMCAWQPPSSYPLSSSSLLLTVSFGHLIPSPLLSHFPHPAHTLNLHPSLLPQWRGAAPIQWTIAQRQEETGVSVQSLSVGKFDRGNLLGQERVPVPPGSTYPSLEPILAKRGSALLIDVLRDLRGRWRDSWTQDHALATLAPKLSKEIGHVRWDQWTANEIEARSRAFGYQFPLSTTLEPSSSGTGSSSTYSPVRVLLPSISLPSSLDDLKTLDPETYARTGSLEPGCAIYSKKMDALVVRCSSSWSDKQKDPSSSSSNSTSVLLVHRLKVEGKKERGAGDWWVGFKDRADARGVLKFGNASASASGNEDGKGRK